MVTPTQLVLGLSITLFVALLMMSALAAGVARNTIRIAALEGRNGTPTPATWQRLTPENDPVISVDPVRFTDVDGDLYLSFNGKVYKLVGVEGEHLEVE